MKTLLRARKNIAQNSKKGFTLVELIVVIVIIAILIAALLPAVLGAIGSANAAADQADARAIMTAINVWVMELSSAQRSQFLDAGELTDGAGDFTNAQFIAALGIGYPQAGDAPIAADRTFLERLGSIVPGFDGTDATGVRANIDEVVFTDGLVTSITYSDRFSDGVRVSVDGGAETGPFQAGGNGG